ncbi:glycosyltransferase family 4 protein [Candidatus Woesearchaeota archaeon]|nr:glycosyltransferase family 4 protein [Candidatus Woesearchaeota archaeon]
MASKRIKVLLCSLYGRSGMLQYSSQLANSLSSFMDVHVLLPDYSETFLFSNKVRLIKVKAPPDIIKTAALSINLFHFKGIIRKIRQVDPDIIHFVDNHPWYLALLKPFESKKLFVTRHEVTPHLGELIRGKMTIYVNKVLDKKATKVIVLGEKLKQELVDRYRVPADKILVFLMGDFTFYLQWKKKGVREEPHTILFFGRILKYKGLDVLLKAVPLAKKHIPDLKVIVAGEGDLTPYKELITRDIEKNLEITNKYIHEKEVPEYFQRSAIIVMPYRDASSSGIVPIAYAFKKALICSDVGALHEFIDDGKTGLLVKPEDPKALAKAIVALLKDKRKRQALGQNGYRKMMAELSWRSIASKLTKEYAQALKAKRNSNGKK